MESLRRVRRWLISQWRNWLCPYKQAATTLSDPRSALTIASIVYATITHSIGDSIARAAIRNNATDSINLHRIEFIIFICEFYRISQRFALRKIHKNALSSPSPVESINLSNWHRNVEWQPRFRRVWCMRSDKQKKKPIAEWVCCRCSKWNRNPISRWRCKHTSIFLLSAHFLAKASVQPTHFEMNHCHSRKWCENQSEEVIRCAHMQRVSF